MIQIHRMGSELSFGPCPPEEFSGRLDERKKLYEVLRGAKDRGRVVMVSGGRGSGKSSFLDWAESEIQNESGEFKCPAIKVQFLETPGMVFTAYRDLLTDLKGHQKFGWFRKSLENSKVRTSIDAALTILEKTSSLAALYTPGVNAGVAVAKGLTSSDSFDYTKLISAFLHIFRSVSEDLAERDQFFAILLDDVQLSSDTDFRLMNDLIQSLPVGIVLITAFRREADYYEKHAKLQGELLRYDHTEIVLGGMDEAGVEEFAKLRYNLSIDDKTAKHLSEKIGDPLCLVGCFNRLQNRGLPPTLESFQEILPQCLDHAQCLYTGLDQIWQDRINSLCILDPPLFLSIISCMLGEKNITRLKDEFDQSHVFRRLDREKYEFAHPSLREYRRKELPESAIIELSKRAVNCVEHLKTKMGTET